MLVSLKKNSKKIAMLFKKYFYMLDISIYYNVMNIFVSDINHKYRLILQKQNTSS